MPAAVPGLRPRPTTAPDGPCRRSTWRASTGKSSLRASWRGRRSSPCRTRARSGRWRRTGSSACSLAPRPRAWSAWTASTEGGRGFRRPLSGSRCRGRWGPAFLPRSCPRLTVKVRATERVGDRLGRTSPCRPFSTNSARGAARRQGCVVSVSSEYTEIHTPRDRSLRSRKPITAGPPGRDCPCQARNCRCPNTTRHEREPSTDRDGETARRHRLPQCLPFSTVYGLVVDNVSATCASRNPATSRGSGTPTIVDRGGAVWTMRARTPRGRPARRADLAGGADAERRGRGTLQAPEDLVQGARRLERRRLAQGPHVAALRARPGRRGSR